MRIVYVRLPGVVGRPPEETMISLPVGVRALSTATRRAQPPAAVAVTFTAGRPNTSTADAVCFAVRTSFVACEIVFRPGRATFTVLVAGSVLKPTASAVPSRATRTGGPVSAGRLRR